MKKTLLFLFIVINISLQAQVSNIVNCAENTLFDLTTRNTELIGSLNPNQTTISYHTSLSDATNNVNPISTPGNYTSVGNPQIIYARIDNFGTITTNYFNLIQNSQLVVNAIISSPLTCTSNATVIVTPSGGSGNYFYSLLLPSSGIYIASQPNNVFSILQSGIYIVRVTDSSGCSLQSNTITIMPASDLFCTTTASANTVTINATGGAPPYTYSINNGVIFQTSNTFTFANGTYSIQVRDLNGCVCSSTVTVTNSGLSVSIGATLDNPTSTLFADVWNGTQPYTYQWGLNGVPINGATNSSINVLGQSGLFSLTVTDATGLTGSASYAVSGSDLYLNNDSFTIYPSNNNISVSSQSVLFNDFRNGLPIVSQQSINNITLTTLSIPTGFSLNPNGTISVLPGTAAGQYTLTYQVCDNQFPNFCLIATATINVVNNGILLKAFIDTNANAIQDNGEANFTQGQFGYILNDNGVINNVSSSNGEYLINDSNPLNSYDLNFTINSAYTSQYTLTTSSYSNVNTSNSGVVTYSFPVTEIPFKDLLVAIYANGTPPRPGFTYLNQIFYKNEGNQSIASGTVNFTKSNAVSITSISQSGTISNANGFSYNFTNLLPGEIRYMNVRMQVPTIPTVSLGQVLTNSVSTTIPVGDINTSNNEASLSQIIVGSFDPNDKTESHGGKILHSTFTSNDYLTYTIQFENTGTYNAENVRVNDVLDPKLDETSIIMIKSSHNYELNRVGNNLNWNFNGIELPPSVANTQIGHGNIVFKIKPKSGYSIGDIIPNTADIFFDFNPAIVTNTFNTEFVSTLAVNDFDMTELAIYPNPVQNSLKITNTSLLDSVSIFSVLGQEVINKKVNGLQTEINTTPLSNGIYFVKISSEGREKTIKIIKE